MLGAGSVDQCVDDLVDIEPSPVQRVGELVKKVEVKRLAGQELRHVSPSLAGSGLGVIGGIEGPCPGPSGPHDLPCDGPADAGLLVEFPEGLQGVLLADMPTSGLHELEDADPPPLVPGAQGGAHRRCRLALALAGVHRKNWP